MADTTHRTVPRLVLRRRSGGGPALPAGVAAVYREYGIAAQSGKQRQRHRSHATSVPTTLGGFRSASCCLGPPQPSGTSADGGRQKVGALPLAAATVRVVLEQHAQRGVAML